MILLAIVCLLGLVALPVLLLRMSGVIRKGGS
jgi:hypothetical protein